MSMEKFAELKKNIEALKKESKDILKQAFEEGCSAIFRDFPEIKMFAWNQYTPYFNDGDECIFSANYYDMTINGHDQYDKDNSGKKYGDKFEKEIDIITDFLKNFDDNDFKSLFGDHVSVSVTPKGAYVESYDHD